MEDFSFVLRVFEKAVDADNEAASLWQSAGEAGLHEVETAFAVG
jgi:hypothetical protein